MNLTAYHMLPRSITGVPLESRTPLTYFLWRLLTSRVWSVKSEVLSKSRKPRSGGRIYVHGPFKVIDTGLEIWASWLLSGIDPERRPRTLFFQIGIRRRSTIQADRLVAIRIKLVPHCPIILEHAKCFKGVRWCVVLWGDFYSFWKELGEIGHCSAL